MHNAGMEQGVGQSMVATASLQLFMRALQATHMELGQMAAQAIASNPALEELPPERPNEEATGTPDAAATHRHTAFINALPEEESLADYLTLQLHQAGLPQAEKLAALALLPYLTPHGMLEAGFVLNDFAAQENMPPTLARRALRRLQELDPPGVGARDLRESLLLQLARVDEGESLAAELLRHHWDALVRHRYAEAARELGTSEAEVAAAARRIARLDPDPGSRFAAVERNVIAPDLVVEAEGETFTVTLTGEQVPRLALSAAYRDMMAEKADDAELRRYLSRCFREGREFIRAIDERQKTLLAVAQAIVARQQEFFRRGPQALAPLRMEEVADALGVHVSTISRAVRGKYLRCRFGLFELRSFFSAALPGGMSGDAASAGAVQARIRELIAAENPAKPLSDTKLEQLLAAEGVRVARRTIAKYREHLKILPASLRRQ